MLHSPRHSAERGDMYRDPCSPPVSGTDQSTQKKTHPVCRKEPICSPHGAYTHTQGTTLHDEQVVGKTRPDLLGGK